MFLKHEAFMDVCIEVRSESRQVDGMKIYGSFWNLGQDGKSWSIGEDVRIKIPQENFKKWKKCVDSGDDLRKGVWIDL